MHALAAGLPEAFRPKSLGSRFGLRPCCGAIVVCGTCETPAKP